jgi:striatin 1/3/4
MRSDQQQQQTQMQSAIPEPMVRDQSGEKPNAFNAGADTNPFTASLNESSTSSGPSDGDGWDFDESSLTVDLDASNVDEFDFSSHHTGKPTNSMGRKKLSIRHRVDPHATNNSDAGSFQPKFVLRGHLDVVRAIIFTGGGTQNEPEICTAGDDGVLKRWYIPGSYGLSQGASDMDIQSHFTHRGHQGMVTCLATCPPAVGELESGLNEGGWIFSGGQDTTVRVWESNMVGPKATLVGHTDVVWAVCILPVSSSMAGSTEERILLASGSGDGTVKIWSVSPPPAPQGMGPGNRRGSVRSISSAASPHPFSYSLISTIVRPGITASPTCITPFSASGDSFIVSYNDAAVIIYDTASGEEISQMSSHETYDGTPATGVNWVVASTISLDSGAESGREEEELVAGATGPKGGVAGIVITGHEDRYVRIFDANSGKFSSPHVCQ